MSIKIRQKDQKPWNNGKHGGFWNRRGVFFNKTKNNCAAILHQEFNDSLKGGKAQIEQNKIKLSIFSPQNLIEENCVKCWKFFYEQNSFETKNKKLKALKHRSIKKPK